MSYTLTCQSFFGEKQAGVPANRRKMSIKVTMISILQRWLSRVKFFSADLSLSRLRYMRYMLTLAWRLLDHF